VPFVFPTMSDNSADRVGSTLLIGSLNPPTSRGIVTGLVADIGAFSPFGVITTKVAALFEIEPPPSATMILVTVAGIALTSRAVIQTAGGYCRAHAELSLTIEDWAFKRAAALGRPRLLSSTVFNPTKIFDDWGAVLSYQLRIDDGTPFTTIAGMPITKVGALERHSFLCAINLLQSAEADGVTGWAAAVSNVQFAFTSVFVAFV
jgi:hypothetical protein